MTKITCSKTSDGLIRASVVLPTDGFTIRQLTLVTREAMRLLHAENAATYECEPLVGGMNEFSFEINPHLGALTQIEQLMHFQHAVGRVGHIDAIDMSRLER